MKQGLFVKKSISSLLKEADSSRDLKRSLGPLNLTMMGVGAIIGAGIFVLAGPAAAKFAGPGIIISYALAAVICVLAALCYAEFASMIPISGSAYTYAYVALGEFPAWIIGLALTLEYLFAFCTVAAGWSGYLLSLLSDFGISLPTFLTKVPLMHTPGSGWVATGALMDVPAMLIIGLIGWFVARGIQTASIINDILVVIKIGVILLFVGCGLAFIDFKNWQPLIPENIGTFGYFGWSGVIRGAGVVFFSFLGFDAVSTLAQEAKNPKRDLPIGMLGSLGIATTVFIIFALVLVGVVHYSNLGVPDSIAVAVNALGVKFLWLRYVIKIAILASLTSVILVMLLGQTRIFYAMAHDGLLPSVFYKINQKHRTPYFNTVVVTLIGAAMAGFFPVDILAQLTSMGALLVFAMVCFGVLVLRSTQPDLPRPFKTPFSPWIPLLGTIVIFGQMVLLPPVTWLQLGIWLGIGCVIYLFYGRKNSKARAALKK